MTTPRWFQNWKQDALRRVEELRLKWRREREKLDLELETTPVESKFSDELIKLMNSEDALGTQAAYHQHEMVAQKADKLLGIETSQHFQVQADINTKKMNALFRQQTLERDRFLEVVDRQFKAICESAKQPPINRNAIQERMETGYFEIDPLEEFAAEERRLWRVAQQEMPQAERFHIANAFALQLERVDVEWKAHAEQMKLDYIARRARIQGRDAESVTVSTPVGRWKSKEKQSQLIHTAPIQQPSANMRQQKSTSSSNKRAVTRQLKELEESYEDAKLRMKFEKLTARRFIERQSLRMNAQIDAMAKCKHLLAAHLKEEEDTLTKLLLHIACFCELVLETNSLPIVLRTPCVVKRDD